MCLNGSLYAKSLCGGRCRKSIFFILNHLSVNIHDGKLFGQVSCVKKYFTNEKIDDWRQNNKPCHQSWVEIFEHFTAKEIAFKNICKIVEFSLCLPGSNGLVERIFSLVNNMWTNEEIQLKVSTLEENVFPSNTTSK